MLQVGKYRLTITMNVTPTVGATVMFVMSGGGGDTTGPHLLRGVEVALVVREVEGGMERMEMMEDMEDLVEREERVVLVALLGMCLLLVQK